MPRTLSLSVKAALYSEATSSDPIVLVEITPPGSSEIIRLSSHPTEQLSTEPLRYGTIHQGEEFEFVLMSAIVPDDQEGSPGATSLIFENVVSDMASIVRSITRPAAVRMLLVFASDPDSVEVEYADFETLRASYDAERVTVDISRSPVTAEPWPAHRITRTRFPGLFR